MTVGDGGNQKNMLIGGHANSLPCKQSQRFEILENVRGLCRDQEHVKFVHWLIHVSHGVGLQKGVLEWKQNEARRRVQRCELPLSQIPVSPRLAEALEKLPRAPRS